MFHSNTREQKHKQYPYVIQLNKILYSTRLCIGKLWKVMMEYRITLTKTQGQLNGITEIFGTFQRMAIFS